ncbi:Protein BLISTER [Linum grandiflorum]
MASAQVLRKQEHLQAGKRRLEEFRKKKAAERAKKSGATTGQSQPSDVITEKNKPLETEQVRVTDSDGVGTSDAAAGTFGVSSYRNDKGDDITSEVEHSAAKAVNAKPSTVNNFSTILSDIGKSNVDNDGFKRSDVPGVGRTDVTRYGQINGMHESSTYGYGHSVLSDGILSDHSKNPQAIQGSDRIFTRYNQYGADLLQQEVNKTSSRDSMFANPGSQISSLSRDSALSKFEAKLIDSSEPNTNFNIRGSGHGAEKDTHKTWQRGDSTADFEQKYLTSPFPEVHADFTQASESTLFNSDAKNSSNHASLYAGQYETNSRKSRPSFLDSINVARPTMGSPLSQTKPYESFMSVTSTSNGTGALGSSTVSKPSVATETGGSFSQFKSSSETDVHELDAPRWKSSVSSSNGIDAPRSQTNDIYVTGKHDFFSSQKNEDFSALEQHIEDLTQEKFSLQRALEASRALAESLAAENTSLTDTYNQQRSNVNLLKTEMEKLQGEIRAHMVELESMRVEYANAQLECNAADERSKLLASEVIGLEEKALRLRSNELKLERELENCHAEIASCKKKMSNLERERLDLHSTIDALQEEKKLMQSKLRKASTGGKSVDVGESTVIKRDMSTSTEDLEVYPDTSNQKTYDGAYLPRNNAPSSSISHEIGQPVDETSSAYIPPEQMRMIQNINELMSELSFEKEELMKALVSESSQCSKLKDLNKELSRKLEAQTQRLELLAAQSMATENITTRLPESRTMQDSPAYADEGDEVVERVLGWIMKLFPGGPSKRRTSKLL